MPPASIQKSLTPSTSGRCPRLFFEALARNPPLDIALSAIFHRACYKLEAAGPFSVARPARSYARLTFVGVVQRRRSPEYFLRPFTRNAGISRKAALCPACAPEGRPSSASSTPTRASPGRSPCPGHPLFRPPSLRHPAGALSRTLRPPRRQGQAPLSPQQGAALSAYVVIGRPDPHRSQAQMGQRRPWPGPPLYRAAGRPRRPSSCEPLRRCVRTKRAPPRRRSTPGARRSSVAKRPMPRFARPQKLRSPRPSSTCRVAQ